MWADGRAYIGDWKEGEQVDERVYVLPNGTVRRGIWENGQRKNAWVNLDDEEAKFYKDKLEEANKKSQEAEEQKRRAEQEI